MPRDAPDYARFVELARLCWRQARMTQDKDVSHHFDRMAREFQEAAAKFDSGELPDIGDGKNERPIV